MEFPKTVTYSEVVHGVPVGKMNYAVLSKYGSDSIVLFCEEIGVAINALKTHHNLDGNKVIELDTGKVVAQTVHGVVERC